MTGPQKYRKRPVVIEAMQNDGTDATALAIEEWSGGQAKRAKPWKVDYGVMVVATMEGVMDSVTTSWIIRGVAGEFYPCDNAIFERTYDPVDES